MKARTIARAMGTFRKIALLASAEAAMDIARQSCCRSRPTLDRGCCRVCVKNTYSRVRSHARQRLMAEMMRMLCTGSSLKARCDRSLAVRGVLTVAAGHSAVISSSSNAKVD